MELIETCALAPSTFDDWLELNRKNSLLCEVEGELLSEDLWAFSFFWYEVKQKFSTVDQLYDAILDLKDNIRSIKEKYRAEAGTFPDLKWERNGDRGVSGSYFLVDETGKRHFVIKPFDEDAGCINSDGFATPFLDSPLRSNMPLYLSSMREVLAYRIALSIGVSSVVPKTEFGIFESDVFHDFSEGIASGEIDRYLDRCGFGDKEKLCSVQEYVQNGKSLFEALQDLQMAGLSDDEMQQRFDQNDFEDANILLWTTYDTDGHLGNFLVYPKSVDEIGNEVLGIKKIDNGLAFPDKNQQLRNNLTYLPNAKEVLSKAGKEKIMGIRVEGLAKQLESIGLESAIPALRERIGRLKELAQVPGITIKEINKAMTKVGKKG